ncbi:MAG: bifunctional oligoribonuclease/PAP phosphatase NrnA [Candidatus Omnitrophica bacterium]|nr:bifunctional oligoribonuclease/PAP phosphatase NrnA [Candidatus Omnitrophota bacterium]
MIRQQILKIIASHNRFLIAGHIHPEGDSIGSQLALANLLGKMGKSVRIINADNVPKNLKFLPGQGRIETGLDFRKEQIEFDAAIVLDSPVLERIGKVRELIKNAYIINIDHHVSNERFGHINWTDHKASAAGEMVYGLYKSSSVPIDVQTALCLYVAIMTDTGSFRYSNTTPATHRIVAELLNFDINPAQIYEFIYETKSFEALKMLGEALENLNRSRDGKIVWFKVTKKMLKKYNLPLESTESFIDVVRMIEGSEVAVFFRELESGVGIKVSLRSKCRIDVNKIAKSFGGGGHSLASGCVIEKKMETAEKLLVKEIKKAIKKRFSGK